MVSGGLRQGLHPQTVEAREALAELARRYHAASWMLGTSGNLSVRVEVDDQIRIVITASGRDKGRLTPADFVEVGADGELIASGPDARPSAETSIHVAMYRARPKARAVLHVHTVTSTLAGIRGLSAATPQGIGALDFTGLEMVKGWGLWDENAPAQLPCFPNHAHVPDIAVDVERYLNGSSAALEVPALLIAGHGLTAWGDSLPAAHRHVEITEFMSQIELAR